MSNKSTRKPKPEPQPPERKLVRTVRYTIEVKRYDDDSIEVVRHNAGINSIYLLGLLEVARQDIFNVITRNMPPATRLVSGSIPAEAPTSKP